MEWVRNFSLKTSQFTPYHCVSITLSIWNWGWSEIEAEVGFSYSFEPLLKARAFQPVKCRKSTSLSLYSHSMFLISHLRCVWPNQDSASAVRRSVVGGDWTRRREGEKPWRPIYEPLPRLPTKAEPSLPRPFQMQLSRSFVQTGMNVFRQVLITKPCLLVLKEHLKNEASHDQNSSSS